LPSLRHDPHAAHNYLILSPISCIRTALSQTRSVTQRQMREAAAITVLWISL